MSRLPVMIVGAGPTGLMMACELKRHNIPFRIIDKKSGPTQGSNATWIQTRTLEIFDVIGIADRFLKIGHQCDTINFYAKGKQINNIPLTKIDSSYPFILMLPQSETERVLNETLEQSKIRVERSLELVNVKQINNGVVSTVRFANGDTENITSHWLIGCDGANSTVREKCQISFLGEDIPEQFMVADAQMSSHLSTNEIHVFFDKGTIFPDKGTLFSAFPWDTNKYRLSANLYLSHPRQRFTEQEVREVVAERTYGNFIVDKVSWISPFWIHGKIVNKMHIGSIFLAGDAAHIHSPAGGQGMNTGLQDAFNLAWKLALVIRDKSKSSLLDTYQSERYPVVKNIVNETEFFTKMILFDKSFFSKLKKFSNKITKRPFLTKRISEKLTQVDIQYKKSPIIHYKEKTNPKSPRQGKRAPDVTINDSKKLYEYLHNSLHNILLFTGQKPTKNNLLKIKKLQKLLSKQFPKLVKTFIITNEKINNFDNIIIDTYGVTHKKYDVKKPTIFIVRPDNYISYISKKLD